MAHVISKACTKCAACLLECPTGSIIEGKDQYYIDTDTCMDHMSCVSVCPVNAIAPFNPVSSVPAAPQKTSKPQTPSSS